ncbi:MAG: transposase [Verrucomicrobia bacterium]|nr:transposase [Verrucomicrobiota bacterium]
MSKESTNLYKARWQIEVFFKQIKQTLKLTDFLGHSANAVRWQVWTALLVYVLLRFLSRMSSWSHSFTRIFAVVHASLWQRVELHGFLKKHSVGQQVVVLETWLSRIRHISQGFSN